MENKIPFISETFDQSMSELLSNKNILYAHLNKWSEKIVTLERGLKDFPHIFEGDSFFENGIGYQLSWSLCNPSNPHSHRLMISINDDGKTIRTELLQTKLSIRLTALPYLESFIKQFSNHISLQTLLDKSKNEYQS